MGGYMTGSQFGAKAAWRVGIFLALTIGFPFIVYGLIVATGARSVGGASGALAVVAGVFLKPIILLGFAISLLSPCWQRMRSLGIPALAGLLVPLLFLLDWPFLLIAGAHWGVGFSLGILRVNLPWFAITALAMLVAMSLASPPDDTLPSQRVATRVCAVLAILLAIIALVTAGASSFYMARIWFVAPGRSAPTLIPANLGYWAFVLKPFVCAAFCAAMAAMTYLSRRESSGASPGGSEAGSNSMMRSPPSGSPGAPRAVFGRR